MNLNDGEKKLSKGTAHDLKHATSPIKHGEDSVANEHVLLPVRGEKWWQFLFKPNNIT